MGVLDYTIAVLVDVLAVAVLVASLRWGCFRHYFSLNLYVIALCAVDAVRYAVHHAYGFKSIEYFYTYFLGDALLVIMAYLMILGFFDGLFRNTSLRTIIRLALFFFFLLVAGISYVFISASVSHFYSRLVVEFQQNMHFAVVILTALLWISLVHLRVAGRQLRLLITGLGIDAAMLAGGYAFQNLLPRELFLGWSELTHRLPALATLAMLAVWCYALLKVPAETGVAEPARVFEPALAEGTTR